MVGRKLDARSYTVMLLVVIGALLALNLFAQEDRSSYSGLASVASALDGVAAANASIATSIDGLANAVDGLELIVEAPGAPGAEADTGAIDITGSTEGAVRLPTAGTGEDLMKDVTKDTGYKGTFNVN